MNNTPSGFGRAYSANPPPGLARDEEAAMAGPETSRVPLAFGTIGASQEATRGVPQSASPTSIDVVLGRGKSCQNHPGNRQMLRLVDENMDHYRSVGRLGKKKLIKSIIRMIQNNGGKFLDRNHDGDGSWFEVSDSVAYKKVGHAFRCSTRKTQPSLSASKLNVHEEEPPSRPTLGGSQKLNPYLAMSRRSSSSFGSKTPKDLSNFLPQTSSLLPRTGENFAAAPSPIVDDIARRLVHLEVDPRQIDGSSRISRSLMGIRNIDSTRRIPGLQDIAVPSPTANYGAARRTQMESAYANRGANQGAQSSAIQQAISELLFTNNQQPNTLSRHHAMLPLEFTQQISTQQTQPSTESLSQRLVDQHLQNRLSNLLPQLSNGLDRTRGLQQLNLNNRNPRAISWNAENPPLSLASQNNIGLLREISARSNLQQAILSANSNQNQLQSSTSNQYNSIDEALRRHFGSNPRFQRPN